VYAGLVVACGLFFAFNSPYAGLPGDDAQENVETATLAGGCFWCMQPPFDALPGVLSTRVGYTGGETRNPTYSEVSSGGTGHAEAVQIHFDATDITYNELLEVFWRNIDPTTPDRQFCDRGSQYRAAIFYHNEAQRKLAEASKKAIVESGRVKPVVTEITKLDAFYEAEEYHQAYYKKNPERYKSYRKGCGRDRRLKQLWGDDAGH
jgi:peptide-methionine (S)-S-oxide reductase